MRRPLFEQAISTQLPTVPLRLGSFSLFPSNPLAHPFWCRNALETALKDTILLEDFPARWPDYAHQAVAFLQSNDTKKILGALVCIRHLLRAFECAPHQPTGLIFLFPKPQFYLRWVRTQDARRTVLYSAVESLFPILFQLFQYLLHQEHHDAWSMQLLIIKTFYSGTQVRQTPAPAPNDDLLNKCHPVHRAALLYSRSNPIPRLDGDPLHNLLKTRTRDRLRYQQWIQTGQTYHLAVKEVDWAYLE